MPFARRYSVQFQRSANLVLFRYCGGGGNGVSVTVPVAVEDVVATFCCCCCFTNHLVNQYIMYWLRLGVLNE